MAHVKVHLLLVLSLLIILAMVAEGRTIGGNTVAETAGISGVKVEEKEEAKTVVCISVHGAEDGDTCINVAKKVSLSTEQFLEINPNIDCDTIFIGQWLCVGGVAFSDMIFSPEKHFFSGSN